MPNTQNNEEQYDEIQDFQHENQEQQALFNPNQEQFNDDWVLEVSNIMRIIWSIKWQVKLIYIICTHQLSEDEEEISESSNNEAVESTGKVESVIIRFFKSDAIIIWREWHL